MKEERRKRKSKEKGKKPSNKDHQEKCFTEIHILYSHNVCLLKVHPGDSIPIKKRDLQLFEQKEKGKKKKKKKK